VPIEIIPGVFYPAYRLMIIVVRAGGRRVALSCRDAHRVGMLIRAGAFQPGDDRQSLSHQAAGSHGPVVWGGFPARSGAGGLAGLMQAPILTVQIAWARTSSSWPFVIIVIAASARSARLHGRDLCPA